MLIYVISKLPTPYLELETELSKVLKEIPNPDIFSDDHNIIIMGRKRLLIPISQNPAEVEKFLFRFEEKVGNVLGQKYKEHIFGRIINSFKKKNWKKH